MLVDDTVLDRVALASWMDGNGLESGELSEFEALSGGTQNIIVRFRRGDRRFVLRRGPRHPRPRSNETLRREMTVLQALRSTDVPHARFIGGCLTEDVIEGTVFYLMEPVDGFNASVGLPPTWLEDRAVRHEAGLSLVAALARLASVDYRRVGLDGFGKPDGFLERQVPRWLAELGSFSRLSGYAGPRPEGIDEVAAWLERNRPTSWTPGILHGDYHVANVMFDRNTPQVTAIVDWEMSTVGDPLLDLGSLLAVWPSADGEPDLIGSAISKVGGLPDEREIIDHYGERSERDLSAVDWYVVLGCFKLGIVLEGSYARSKAGQADVETGNRLHATALDLFARARKRIAGTP